MKRYDKLLFVDKTDTSVAPMAETIMQDLLLLDDILIESRGLVVLFPEPLSTRAAQILTKHGLSPGEHSSTPFKAEDFDERTLVLTMTQDQKAKLLETYAPALNLFTLGECIGSVQDISDPYGGSEDDYEQCYDQLRGMLLSLAEKMKEEDA